MEDLAAITPGELQAAMVGASKYRQGWYELGMFVAWHIAVFSVQAENGKLKPWDEIQRKFFRKAEAPVRQQSWQARKAEMMQQVARLKKHQAQRQKPPVKRGR